MSHRPIALALCPGRIESVRRELAAEVARPAELGADVAASLRLSSATHPDRMVRSACGELAASLEAGLPLSAAFERIEAVAGFEAAAMAKAGEHSGSVAAAMRTLERVLDATAGGTARIRQKWIAPGIAIGLAVVVSALMLAGPIPELLGMAGRELPFPLLVLSRALASPTRALVAGLLLATSLLLLVRLLVASRRFDELADDIPFLGPLRRAGRSALVCRAFSLLLPAGVDAVELFRIAARLAPEGRGREELEEAALRLGAGGGTEEALRGVRGIAPLARALLVRPGASDRFAFGFGRMADYYESEVDRLGLRLATVAETVAFVVSGVVAGGVVIAIWTLYFSACGRMID
jgi:type II secretory pathway component PulF